MATAPRSSKVIAVSFSLWSSMDLSTSWARAIAEAEMAPAAACPAAKAIAARVVMSHRGDETDAEADRGASAAARAAAGKDDAAAGQAAAELVAGPGQPAADRAGRAAEPSGRLVERQALEVAEHDRQPKWTGQAVDLAVEDLGLLAVEDRLVGRRDRRIDRTHEPEPGLSWRRPPRACAGGRAGALALRAVRSATP